MPVQRHMLDEHCQMIYRIERDDMLTEAGLAGALDDLDTALDYLKADLSDDDDADFFGFRFIDRGAPFGGDEEDDPDEAFDPWNESSLKFWSAVHAHPALRPRISQWIENLAQVLELAGEYDTVWEDEETQLGEPLVSLLAVIDRTFISGYVRLLERWDMDHEVNQEDAIDAIIAKHGICDETEDLLFCRVVVNAGQHGGDQLDSLFPQLQAHYGDFTKSPLFRRMVTRMHAIDTKWRAETLAKGQTPSDRTFFHTQHEALNTGTALLVAELDAA